ncbi:MAG TPA: M48 family metallopeptidase [Geobacteraceae bacterium]
MSGMRGVLFDGKSSARLEVAVFVEGERLRVRGDGVDASYDLAGVTVSPKLGTIRRVLALPDGARCEIEDDAPLDALLKAQERGRFTFLLHRWETSLRRVLVALLLIIAAVWGVVKYVVPAVARKAAFAMPAATEVVLGRQTLDLLDRSLLTPSRLPAQRRAELAERFRRITRELPDNEGYRLEFRASERIGANAFALPSGIVIVTDGLVELAKNDEGIVGVLAHEIGHVRCRHALRQVLQNSATGLIVATVTGDILSASSLAATLPTVLIDAKFSRDFETEADDAAVAYLKGHGIPVSAYAEMLARLQAEHSRREGEEGNGRRIDDFFATHPVTRDRIGRIMSGR